MSFNKQILTITIILISFSALAESLRIHSVTPNFVKFEDGRVGFLDNLEGQSYHEILLRPDQLVEVVLDDEANIQHLSFADVEVKQNFPYTIPKEIDSVTVLPSYASAQNLLKTFPNNDIQDSQCYDRAHSWSYLAYTRSNVKLQKAFLFFSDNYIERYRFKWWFHVAPYASLMMKGELTERIMDRKFSQAPLRMKLWTDIFMYNKVECKVVPLYTDYSEHPNEDDCYIIKTSIYQWQPKDLERFAHTGFQKTQFIEWEVRYALENAYGIK